MEKKKKIIYPIIIVLIVVGFFSCIIAFAIEASSNGFKQKEYTYTTETREVKDFDKVVLEGTASLEIVQGEKESLTVESDIDEMQWIESSVENRTLTLSNDSNHNQKIRITLFSMNWGPEVKYKLTVKDLSQLETKGTGEVTINNLNTKDFTIVMKGVGNTEIHNISSQSIDASIEGTGNTEISGKTDRLSIDLKGVGDFEGKDLLVKDAIIMSEGTGNVTVNASDSLDITLNGICNVEYYGNPKLKTNINGLGHVDKVTE
jgi:hypothetical protein